ncbi:protein O-mannosyl-transferase Tmtc3 [Drosophila subobscura]|uniref:protein O-mannosyl-transferase Tmtc3 n=1 Tax=Drosophila subobscura TaxID=7241 RepID=UPI00155B1B49|nr:protein O-mannosyl-transferase Tmtc3 [Drosophila subobscura]XP_034653175.1 protein O-mannosyl-transferase Tmtc3 [Drosophila subobscura]
MSTNPNSSAGVSVSASPPLPQVQAAAAAFAMPCNRNREREVVVRGSSSQRNLLEFVCICVACIACYYNSTQCGLVFDDISAIRDNKDLRPHTPLRNVFLNDFWGTPMRKEQSHKSYRPLTVLTFRFNYLLHALEPFGYHLVNLLLHLMVCLLWRRVCRLLLRQCAAVGSNATSASLNTCAFVASLLFAIHPVHTEAVTGVVGRAELLSSICFLAAFLSYAKSVGDSGCTRRTNWLGLFLCFGSCLSASMLCKEQGITIAGICVVYELFVVHQLRPLDLCHFVLRFFEEQPEQQSPKSGSRRWSSSALWKRLTFLAGITLALLAGRVYVMGSELPIFTRFDNPASAADTPERQLTYGYLIYLNCWLLLCPSLLCCDWTMGTVPLLEGFSDARNVTTVCTFLALGLLVAKACFTRNLAQSRTLLMCLGWMVLPFLPASNLFFPVGFVVAERILYMPSMGYCLLVAYGFEQMQRRCSLKWRTLGQAALAVLLLSHALKTHQRNRDWRTEYSLFMSGVHVNQRNAKLYNNVGHALENEGVYEEALLYFQQAVRIQTDDIGAHINVGRTFNNLKRYAEAEQAYVKAKALFPQAKPGVSYHARIAPNHLNVFINLANLIAKNQTRLEEADHLYRQAISMRSDYVQAYINRGDILMKLNRTSQAQEVYEQALLYDSENADIYYNLGVVFLEQGKSQQAQVYFNKAIELYPEHEQALLNSAILLQELGGEEARKVSRSRLYKVLAKDDHNEKVYFNLGMLAMDESSFEEAEQFFKRAIHLKSDFRSALFNLALLLADTKRPLDAVPYLNQLIRHHASHVKGLILLGDIYINHMKDLDAAEKCYRSILHYDPQNTQGLHNLCVVFVERKRLAKAAACLQHAQRLAPAEDYIGRHLQIVHSRLQKINKLPESAPERQLAYEDYDPHEFELPQDRASPHKSRKRS